MIEVEVFWVEGAVDVRVYCRSPAAEYVFNHGHFNHRHNRRSDVRHSLLQTTWKIVKMLKPVF